MRYNRFGNTGLVVSELCLGAMTFGNKPGGFFQHDLDQAGSTALVKQALDGGVNFVDTANVYSSGQSEEFLGQALRDLGIARDQVVIATKGMGPMGEGPNDAGCSRYHLLGQIDASLARLGIDAGERLAETLPKLLGGRSPQASLLHGDLWSGNAAFLADGLPVLFDPAVYFGDRETDLAMTELFGGFPRSFYAAYAEAWPLDAGYAVRRDLYNLYHVLNHANLFGGGYAAQAEALIGRLLAEAR